MYGLRADTDAARAYLQNLFSLYAAWGVDFVKVDDIARGYPHCQREIELISGVRGCRREMVLSLSPGPAPRWALEHLKQYAHLWRITDDFWDEWPLLRGMFKRAEKWCVHAGPGHWPDADMLPIGALRQDAGADEVDEVHPARTAHYDDAVVHDALPADDRRGADQAGRYDLREVDGVSCRIFDIYPLPRNTQLLKSSVSVPGDAHGGTVVFVHAVAIVAARARRAAAVVEPQPHAVAAERAARGVI